jgi:RNA polymerase sigma-70 factor (ECF subfamily)
MGAGGGVTRDGRSGEDGPDSAELERRWVRECRAGDANACAALVRGYQDLALRTAFLMTNDRQAAEDVAQNAFLAAFRHLSRFDLDRSFRPWFLAILANEARMHLRVQRRRATDPLDSDVPDVGPADGLLVRLIRDDERGRVRAALMELDEPFRTTVILHYFNDLSIPEIASATDTPSGTVKSRLHRGREQLRRLLGDAPAPNEVPEPTHQGSRRMSR